MKLSEVRKSGKYKFLRVEDKSFSGVLQAYGFVGGIELVVINKTPKGCVVEVLGSKFSVNQKLASMIEIGECARNVK